MAVTGSADDAVRIWDLTTDQELGQPLTGATSASLGVQSVVVTDVGGRPFAVTGDRDGIVRTWDLLSAAGL